MKLGRATSALLVGVLACGNLGASCRDRPVAPYPKSEVAPASDEAVGPGDIFEVRVYDEPRLTGKYQVAEDGSIAFPLLDHVQVDGMVPSEIERELQKRLADGYLRNPQVLVVIEEYRSKKITVSGSVRQPGTFAYRKNMSIVEAIARAGDFNALAKKNSVKVTRQSDGKRRFFFVAVEDIRKGKAPDFMLRPGDKVFVDERPF